MDHLASIIRPVTGADRTWVLTVVRGWGADFVVSRGFVIAAVHVGALERSRALKPAIPAVGKYGIPLRDEIEFEMRLDA